MKYGLIGEKLGHSFSPEIHAQVADYEYELREVAPEALDAFLKEKDFNAINVTIPYKKAVIPYLDEISASAKGIGAVNTIVNKNGKLFGYNTDFDGMKALALKLGLDMAGKKTLILGSGGTSLTAAAVAKSLGAAQIYRVSRRKAANSEKSNASGESEFIIGYDEAMTAHADADFIINTTPCGMYPENGKKPIDISAFSGLSGVIDAIYNPLRSELVLDALERGIPASGGLYMLSAQGVIASGLFTGKAMDAADIERAYGAVLKSRQNIVLTGMPTSGKTSVGKRLSALFKKPFVDSDEEFSRKTGMSAADYIRKFGEESFREKESEAISEICRESGRTVATGGGAVLREKNIRAMKANGLVVFIDRPLEMLQALSDRPLSSEKDALKRLYEERIDIYRNSADIIADGRGSVEEVADRVYKAVL